MAANNRHVCDVSQASYLSVCADMQGFLEKKGVLGNKSKLWCSLQQSTLYMQRSNVPKPQSHGDTVKTIDLKDCHQVRKVTTEITGTHLEICRKKKRHVFICSTSENCSIWIKALQAAMTLKDAGQFVSGSAAGRPESTHDTNAYEDYNVSITAVTQRNSIVGCGSVSNEGVSSDAYSTTSVHHHPVVASDILKDDSKDSAVSDDEEESSIQILLDSLTGRDSPIPDYVHPLIEEDVQPFEDLRHFLEKHHDLCHVNYLYIPTEDPVNSLKSYLVTLSNCFQ